MANASPRPVYSLRTVSATTGLLVGLFFIALVLLQCRSDWLSAWSDTFIDSYTHLAYLVAQQHPENFRLDFLLNDPSVAFRPVAAYPWFFHLLDFGRRQIGFFPTLSILQGVLGMIYLFSAFALLYKFTGRPWTSALVAAATAVRMQIFPGEQWGVLSVAMVVPGTFFMALSPLLFLGWLQSEGKPWPRRLIFLLAGLMGNLHPLSWLIMTFCMLFAQLLKARCNPSALKETILCGIIALLPMLPFIWQWFFVQRTVLPEPLQIKALQTLLAVFIPIRVAYFWEHPDELLRSAGWLLMGGWALFSARRKMPPEVWGFLMGSLVLFFGAYAVNEWVLIPRHQALLDGYRMLKYLLLPVTLATGLWLASFDGIRQLGCAALMLALLVVVNFQILARDTQRMLDVEVLQSFPQNPIAMTYPLYHQWELFIAPENATRAIAQRSLLSVASWIQQHLPSETTLIHVSEINTSLPSKVRALAERSITWTVADVGGMYLYNRHALATWQADFRILQLLRHQNGLCSMPEVRFVHQKGATHMLCLSAEAHLPLAVAYRNEAFVLYILASGKP